jgi:protoporphyrinogen oxidase
MNEYFESLPIEMNTIDRNVRVFHKDGKNKTYLLDYPFEVGIKDLPIRHKLDCIFGYFASRFSKKESTNFEEWINNDLGYGIAKHFMIPYNNKIWSCDLKEISTDLVLKKVEPEPAHKFFLRIFGKGDVGRAYQARFYYPKNGVQEVIDYFSSKLEGDIECDSTVDSIIKSGGEWSVSTSQNKKYTGKNVISTIPLNQLLEKVEGVEVNRSLIEKLRWNNTYFVLVGLKKNKMFNLINDAQWIFFSGKEIFYRLSMMHTFSNDFPTALVAEVTANKIPENMTEDELVTNIVEDLLEDKIVTNRDDIEKTDIKLIDYTYPIPTSELETMKTEVEDQLEAENLFLLGRNGRWDYVNMDSVISNAKTLSDKLIKQS